MVIKDDILSQFYAISANNLFNGLKMDLFDYYLQKIPTFGH